GKTIGGSGLRSGAVCPGRSARDGRGEESGTDIGGELYRARPAKAGSNRATRSIMRDMETSVQFVQWLRSVAPYIHAFRGKTFVVAFPGELVKAGALPVLA